MLAERFDEVLKKRAEETAQQARSRATRDQFVKTKFGELDTAFASMVEAVIGNHSKLVLVKTLLTDTITTRTFPSLDKTVIELRSTLNGPVEKVVFTPALEFATEGQFGVIAVESEGIRIDLGGDKQTPALKSILKRGLVMRGKKYASLGIEVGKQFKVLKEEVLEDFLARLFIRSGRQQ